MNAAYNNSAWLGEVPLDWRRTCIKRVADFSPSYSGGKPDPDEICTVVPMDAVSEFGAIRVENQEVFSDVTPGLTLFENGDVLFAKITPCMENGKGAQVSNLPTRYAFGSTEFHVMRPSHGIDGKFLYFATFNPFFRAWAEKNMQGAAGQQRVTTRFLKYSMLPLPPLAEQKRIAAYLDASCAAIDRAVETKRKQLETLDALRKSIIQKAVTQGLNPKVKMKESGVEWLGPIPEHWRAQKLKRVFAEVDYGISQSTEQVGTYAVLKMGNIVRGEIVFTKIEYVEEVEEALILGANDLLFNRTNSLEQVAKVGLFRGDKADNVTFASYLVRLQANHKNHPGYLNHLLNAEVFLGLARKMAIPSVQQANLNPTRYCRLEIPVPPLAEQIQIADFLDKRCEQIKAIEQRLTAQLTTLTAYRKSLIHECVTGKRRISEADVARAETANRGA
jgi:type I restriction enzyme S subunit